MPAPVSSTGRKMGDAEEAAAACKELEASLAELHAQYDMYFLGQERRPPTKAHDSFKKQLNDLKGQYVRQTAVKFRIGSIAQRYLSYERMWDRTIKEIEAGTYTRDVKRARRHREKKTQNGPEAFNIDEELDVSEFEEDIKTPPETELPDEEAAPPPKMAPPAAPVAAKPATGVRPAVPGVPAGAAAPTVVAPVKTGTAPAAKTGVKPVLTPDTGSPVVPQQPPRPAVGSTGVAKAFTPAGGKPSAAPAAKPAPAPAPAAAAQGGLTDQKIKAIYDAYVTAKRRCGEDTSGLSLNSVADTLKKQVPTLMQQHKAKSVEFKVVIKDGKAVLRALPKE